MSFMENVRIMEWMCEKRERKKGKIENPEEKPLQHDIHVTFRPLNFFSRRNEVEKSFLFHEVNYK